MSAHKISYTLAEESHCLVSPSAGTSNFFSIFINAVGVPVLNQ